MYCFYNHVDVATAQSHWNCRVQQRPDVAQMGCTLVPSAVVRRVHGVRVRKNFRSVHQYPEALPWRCLFHHVCHQCSLVTGSNHADDVNGIPESEWGWRLSEYLETDDERLIDPRDLIHRLDLNDLVKRFASGSFIPIPERIVVLHENDWLSYS